MGVDERPPSCGGRFQIGPVDEEVLRAGRRKEWVHAGGRTIVGPVGTMVKPRQGRGRPIARQHGPRGRTATTSAACYRLGDFMAPLRRPVSFLSSPTTALTWFPPASRIVTSALLADPRLDVTF